MSAGHHAIPCANNPHSDEDERTCEWCASMLDYRPVEGWHSPLKDEEHEESIALFGGPHLSSRQRWARLSKRLGNSMYANWARLEDDSDPVESLPCSPELFDQLVQQSLEGRDLNPEQRRWLNEGIRLSNGLCLRYMGHEWYLNEVGLGAHLHLNMVLDLLGRESSRRGWNVAKLLTGLSALHVKPPQEVGDDAPNFFFRGRYHRLIDPHHRPIGLMLTWLALDIRVQRSAGTVPNAAMSGLAWAYDFKVSTTDAARKIPPQRLIEEAFSNRPAGLFEGRSEPWMSLWDGAVSTMEEVDNLDYPLVTGSHRLRMRVRTNHNRTRLVLVPNQPELLAILLYWAFSPLMSRPGKLLLGLQHNWSRPYFKRGEIPPEVARSLQFCHGILEGISGARVAVEHDRVLIIGQLGHVYEVSVGDGQHGAPYRIRHMRHFQRGSGQELCIHSGRQGSKVPIGDTLGSVLLSLYNDITAARHIDSLAAVVCQSPPFGFPERPDDRWRSMLDDSALEQLSNLARRQGAFMRHQAPEHHWYAGQRAYPLVEEAGAELGQGRFRQFLDRMGQRSHHQHATGWLERFQAALEVGEAFPYDMVMDEWRTKVTSYEGRVAHRRRQRWERGLPRGHQVNLRRAMRLSHRHNGDRHQIGDGRDGERRWCEAFARVWGLLLHQPIGSWVDVPRMNDDALSFQHGELQLSIRSSLERRFTIQMLRWCGYVKDSDREKFARYRRRDHPQANARMRVCEALGKLQRQQDVRGAPPRWWNYVEPFAAPAEMGDLRWPFHEDLRDTPQRERNEEAKAELSYEFERLFFD